MVDHIKTWSCRTASAIDRTDNLIKASPIPYTIVRATQFFEFVGGIAQAATEGQTVRLPPVLMQPIASDDVAAVMADAAITAPLNGTVDLAGPEPICQDHLVRRFLNATGDARTVITDPKALYYGIEVNDQSLTPGDNPTHASARRVSRTGSAATPNQAQHLTPAAPALLGVRSHLSGRCR